MGDEKKYPDGFTSVAADFAGQIATAVWLRELSEAAAQEALRSFALACHQHRPATRARLLAALLTEYRRRRERQDACS